jgi:hypothetical protein
MFEQEGAIGMLPVKFKNDEEKKRFSYMVQAALLTAAGADWFITVNDTWVSSPATAEWIQPRNDPDRRQAICVVLVTRTSTSAWMQYYRRKGKRIVWEELSKPETGVKSGWLCLDLPPTPMSDDQRAEAEEFLRLAGMEQRRFVGDREVPHAPGNA